MHVGHGKTMQARTRRHIMWSLIRIFTVNLQPVGIENCVKILLTWIGKFIWFEFTLHHMTIKVVLTLWMRNSYPLFLSIMFVCVCVRACVRACVCVCVCVCVCFYFCYIMSNFLIILAVFTFTLHCFSGNLISSQSHIPLISLWTWFNQNRYSHHPSLHVVLLTALHDF